MSTNRGLKTCSNCKHPIDEMGSCTFLLSPIYDPDNAVCEEWEPKDALEIDKFYCIYPDCQFCGMWDPINCLCECPEEEKEYAHY